MQEIVIGQHHLYGKLCGYGEDGDAAGNAGVLFIHGWGSDTEASGLYCETLAELGMTCLAVDLRGHGQSPGYSYDFSRADFLQDVVAAYDTLLARGVDGCRISLVGSSFGGYMAALLVGARMIEKLILRVPANYPDQGFDKAPAQGAKAQDREEFKSTRAIQAVQNFTGQTLVVESEKDSAIPSWMVQDYLEAAQNGQHFVMEDAPHTISTNPYFAEQYNQYISAWLTA